MDYAILGPLQMRGSGRDLPLGGLRQRAVLALLLLHRNQVVSTERLIDELWGETPPPTAGKVVQNAVSRLRKEIGATGERADAVLVSHGRGYELRVAPGELDLDRFEGLVADGRQAMERGDSRRAGAILREALGLWRGPPLADLAYEPFAQTEIPRLEERRLVALEERIDADLAAGEHVDLVGELEALIEAHPHRERLRASLMLALYRAGRQTEALQVYQDTRRELVDQVGVEPGPALRRLERQILDQDPALDLSRSARSPVRRRSGRILVAAGAGLIIAAAIAVVISHSGSGRRSAGIVAGAGDSLAAIDPATNQVVAEVPVGHEPTGVTIGNGAAWVLSADDQTISRVSLRTKRATTFGVGGTPVDLAAGRGVVWVGAGDTDSKGGVGAQDDRLLRMRAATQIVDDTIPLPQPPGQASGGRVHQIAVAGARVWAISATAALARVDAATGRVAQVRSLQAQAVAAGPSGVWAISAVGPTLVRVDARTAAVVQRVHLGATALDDLAVGAGAVWAVSRADGTLWRIDPGPRPITHTISVGAGANAVAVGDGAVWVANSVRGTVSRVDPRSGRVVATIGVGNTPRAVAAGAGGVWVSLGGGTAAISPAAVADRGAGVAALPGSTCRPILRGPDPPQYLIVSDFPLHGGPLDTAAMPDAVAFVLRQRGFHAGRFALGYQSCDDSTADTGTEDPSKCTSTAKLFAADRDVLGVVGPFQSGCAGLQIPIANGAPGGPLAIVSPTNSYIGLTRRDPTAPEGALARLYPSGTRNYARIFPADDAQAIADATLIKRLGARNVFLLQDGSPYGVPFAALFRAAARRVGLPLRGTARWSATAAGYSRLAARVGRAHPGAVFLSGTVAANAGRLVQDLRARIGRTVPVVAPDAFGPTYFLMQSSRGAAKGMYLSVGGTTHQRLLPTGRRFVRAFASTQPNGHVGDFAVYAAGATEVLLSAIARSNGTRSSVTRGLLSTSLPDDIVGGVAFDRFGDIVTSPVTILQVERESGVSDVEHFEGARIVTIARVHRRGS